MTTCTSSSGDRTTASTVCHRASRVHSLRSGLTVGRMAHTHDVRVRVTPPRPIGPRRLVASRCPFKARTPVRFRSRPPHGEVAQHGSARALGARDCRFESGPLHQTTFRAGRHGRRLPGRGGRDTICRRSCHPRPGPIRGGVTGSPRAFEAQSRRSSRRRGAAWCRGVTRRAHGPVEARVRVQFPSAPPGVARAVQGGP